ncbi:hypothetical protein L207DRAFT_616178 [Hyaloscypha variabilis F]|uniref:Uncharacterized protein n=1 Tax=Hyaloscypha variabilis (strain UAMH 11265 / GT02V1 / F) TaxID=1149755 RepID=A0A2J6QT03_HYAVF|nr:hypothetical protein L207DRAFT_616178 [Hyaloscypha variabilis F]
MPAKKAKAKAKQLSELARIYSHPLFKEHADLEIGPFLKSGLTPVFKQKFSSKEDFKIYDNLVTYQRVRFRGFTAAELHALESLAPFSTIRDDKTAVKKLCPIHEAFRKPKWKVPLPKHQARFPIGNGNPGYWDVNDPKVWAAIEPGVRLASKLLSDSWRWGWLDALVAGKMTKINAKDLPKDPRFDYYRFSKRPPQTYGTAKAKKVVEADIEMAASKIQFQLYSGEVDPDTGIKRKYNVVGEVSFGKYKDEEDELDEKGGRKYKDEEDAIVWVAFETITPLLDSRISAAERMLCHFRLGVTLFHEFVHVFFNKVVKVKRKELKPKQKAVRPGEPEQSETDVPEPYYIGEVFGNITSGFEFNQPTRQRTKGLPNGGIFQGPMHGGILESFISLEDYPILKTKLPADWLQPTFFPVPLQYFFDIQNPNFWNVYVSKYGSNSVQMGPKVIGSKFVKGKFYGLERGIDTLDEADENSRRHQVARILEAWDTLQEGLENSNIASMPPSTDEDVEMEDNTNIDDQTFKDIIDYLIERRRELALDSLHFRIGEHVLFAHILNDGLEISPEEFRAFLKRCTREKRYFRWVEINEGPMPSQGIVSRVEAGWPVTELEPREYTAPKEDIIQLFHTLADRVMNKGDEDLSYFNVENQFDFDIQCTYTSYPKYEINP